MLRLPGIPQLVEFREESFGPLLVLEWIETQGAHGIPAAAPLRERLKWIVAMFDHVTSRNGDPLLHRHCVINNVCQRHDGTWGTIDSRTLHNWARTLGPLFRSTLAVELRKLGLELTEAKTAEGQSRGYFEVAGVPESLVKTWSSRREEMLEHLEGERPQSVGRHRRAIRREGSGT